ncbi:acetylxylan esterase [Proteiniphilum sp. UBA5384]|jgi:cephalosporin-C deacetylase-like acetyl esterase|uniref:acetylxylan esterase n=1 Tax=Proteiniphilum sp. UBA5384 TaxID=1947279 RepID=UPI0025F07B29|nr:acetylxylan esterase [Proteiniphilum sp. UBA5384]
MKKIILQPIVFILFSTYLFAQLPIVEVSLDRDDWLYQTGDSASFGVAVSGSLDSSLQNTAINYELSHDMMEPFLKGSVHLKNGFIRLGKVSMKEPGFLRCKVDLMYHEKLYEGVATAAFSPEKIVPTTPMPEDFADFWEMEMERIAAIPLNSTMRLLEDKCTAKTNVYEVSFQNDRSGSKIYGILCVPKNSGQYPVLMRLPYAGVYQQKIDLKNAEEKGIITLVIGIHGIPETLDSEIYKDLAAGPLTTYGSFGWYHRDAVYYKRAYLGCKRAIDFIFTLDQFDKENIVVWGGSQGGALSIITGALDKRVKGIVTSKPSLCDMTGYLHGRAGGPPRIFMDEHNTPEMKIEKAKVSPYFDVVNFSKIIQCPVFLTLGYNDITCPPTSIYASYNVINSEKGIKAFKQINHFQNPPELQEAQDKAIDQFLNLKIKFRKE